MTDLATAAKALLDAMDNRSIPMSQLEPEIGIGEAIEKASEKRRRRIDECKSDLRTALASETVSAWQPIETAPESCRGEYPRYILFYNGCHVGVGFCYPSEDGDNGTLYVDESDAIITPEPTHWQPLPAPPALQPAEVKK